MLSCENMVYINLSRKVLTNMQREKRLFAALSQIFYYHTTVFRYYGRDCQKICFSVVALHSFERICWIMDTAVDFL